MGSSKWLVSLTVLVISVLLMRWYTSNEAGRTFNRIYQNSTTVQNEYNSWTQDGILEYYWGHHIHLGYYPDKTATGVDFRQAKVDFTKELFKWAIKITNREQLLADNLKHKQLTLFDAGCGFGGSTMYLTSKYNFKRAIGITLSDFQVARANEILTETLDKYPNNRDITFYVADVLKLNITEGIKDKQFDIVWCLEMEPHIPNKEEMINQLLGILKPGGLLILGCWNIRDTSGNNGNKGDLSAYERDLVRLLEIEWGHPFFWSIKQYEEYLEGHDSVEKVYSDDWSEYTTPSWYESLYEIIRRPKMLFWAIVHPSCWNDRWGDLMGIVNMDEAFRSGLMQYGVFAITKKE